MSSASRDNVPLMDNVMTPKNVMSPENVMTPENDMGKENDFSSSNDAVPDTPDNSSWTSPMTSLFSPGNNANTESANTESANTESANTDNNSWMPSLNSGADADANTDADVDNGSPMTSMFSSEDTASPSDAVQFDSPDIGAPMMDATPKKQNYFSELVSGMQWGFDWVSIVKYVVILILLALMGLNVFSYLGDASDGAATLLERISNLFSGITSDLGKGIKVVVRQTTKTTADGTKAAVDMAADGTKGVVNVSAGAIDSGVNVLEQQLEKNGRTASAAYTSAKATEPAPDMVGNVTQSGGTGSGKSGYCYIGEDRGFRSCVKVGQMDQCMSGDIFPTEAICINPNLRE